jgi:Cd2+/Zn2+-exporting ATPase
VAFDKTGTLTEGEPRVTDVRPYDGVAEPELLRVAASVEQRSDHPLAEAVVEYSTEHLNGHPLADAHDLESITGRGLTATVEGRPVHIGKAALFGEIDGPPLPEAIRNQVAALERMVMISGDNQRVVDAVADDLGLDEARGDLLPDDKVDTVRTLRADEDVAMVGDGVNDAPAMANATVGIAMGAAGSDAALETADVALMADDLSRLPFAVGLSRQTRRVITQNLWIALGMVAVLVPATIAGLTIGPAVVLHEGSTLFVVGNALRLLGYEAA